MADIRYHSDGWYSFTENAPNTKLTSSGTDAADTITLDAGVPAGLTITGGGGQDTFRVKADFNTSIIIDDATGPNTIVFETGFIATSVAYQTEDRQGTTVNTGIVITFSDGTNDQTITIQGVDSTANMDVTKFQIADGQALSEEDFVSTYASGFGATQNNLPTSTNAVVTLVEDGEHVFKLANFAFTDLDTGDTLASVTLDTLPTAGVLEYDDGGTWKEVLLSGTAGDGQIVKASVSKADIEGGKLRFSPAANANGTAYATLAFKVNDGTADSASANTVTFNVTAVNDAPRGGQSGGHILRGGNPRGHRPVHLQADDVDDANAGLTYTVTGLPASGQLQIIKGGTTTTLAVNDTFTQADIDMGHLVYIPPATPADTSFTLTVADDGADDDPATDGDNLVSAAVTVQIVVRQVAAAPDTNDNNTVKIEVVDIDEGTTGDQPGQQDVAEDNTVDFSDKTGAYVIETGDGTDEVTTAQGDDEVNTGLGDDIVRLEKDDGGIRGR